MFAALLALSNAVMLTKDKDAEKIPKPLAGVKPQSWDPETLPKCPAAPVYRQTDSQKGDIVKYPYVGANCVVEVASEGVTLVMTQDINTQSFEHCPDQTNDDRQTLLDGKTSAVKCPADGSVKAGCNCFETTGMAQVKSKDINTQSFEHCPDQTNDDRQTLLDGKTSAVKCPADGSVKAGCNCFETTGMAQMKSKDINTSAFEHCPDQTNDDRQTLIDGRTTAVKCPADGTVKAGCNCFETTGIAQKQAQH